MTQTFKNRKCFHVWTKSGICKKPGCKMPKPKEAVK